MTQKMRLYRVGYDIVSAPSQERAAEIVTRAYGEPPSEGEEIYQMSGKVTFAFEDDVAGCLASASQPVTVDGLLCVTDDAQNWAEFWPEQIVASELS